MSAGRHPWLLVAGAGLLPGCSSRTVVGDEGVIANPADPVVLESCSRAIMHDLGLTGDRPIAHGADDVIILTTPTKKEKHEACFPSVLSAYPNPDDEGTWWMLLVAKKEAMRSDRRAVGSSEGGAGLYVLEGDPATDPRWCVRELELPSGVEPYLVLRVVHSEEDVDAPVEVLLVTAADDPVWLELDARGRCPTDPEGRPECTTVSAAEICDPHEPDRRVERLLEYESAYCRTVDNGVSCLTTRRIAGRGQGEPEMRSVVLENPPSHYLPRSCSETWARAWGGASTETCLVTDPDAPNELHQVLWAADESSIVYLEHCELEEHRPIPSTRWCRSSDPTSTEPSHP